METELEVIAQIVKARKQRGLSQQEVADRAGVTQQVVSRLENRSHSPNLKNLVKITNALELKIQVVDNIGSQLTEHNGMSAK
ncbi:helix-turn-helix domain-containing protein [Desulfofarcimen acetoxidans]|uniref:helix-turn-helix domain-containing protein n=1 Tax=Desulfofarcimen acetoxidans TaxID=58138 RepID=UPI00019E5A42|nr:helix-turn-helix transcriptional regulator [Desulfofarcimen acetoxidans]